MRIYNELRVNEKSMTLILSKLLMWRKRNRVVVASEESLLTIFSSYCLSEGPVRYWNYLSKIRIKNRILAVFLRRWRQSSLKMISTSCFDCFCFRFMKWLAVTRISCLSYWTRRGNALNRKSCFSSCWQSWSRSIPNCAKVATSLCCWPRIRPLCRAAMCSFCACFTPTKRTASHFHPSSKNYFVFTFQNSLEWTYKSLKLFSSSRIYCTWDVFFSE